MTVRIAKALDILRGEVNTKYPDRSKDSDGWVGDASHQSRDSDHNPWIVVGKDRVVSALDLTHDPRHGFDSYAFAEWLRQRRDPRIKYVISNGRIFSTIQSPWVWRTYTGANKHDHHMHISVKPDQAHFDDPSPWGMLGAALPPIILADHPIAPPSTVRPGASNEAVSEMQKLLGVKVTGTYPVRSETYFALCLFQIRNGLDPDGACGPATWSALKQKGVV